MYRSDVPTVKELQALDLYALGHSRSEIGRQMHLSVFTIGDHLASVRRKLGARSSIHAFRIAVQRGLISP